MRGVTSVRALAMSYSALLVVLSGFQSANAGPPFKTDDPVPVALGHYELYTAAIGTYNTSGGMPNVELTYGLIPNGQLQIGGELAFNSAEEGTGFGYGDTQLSFKYRFIDEDTKGFMPQVAIFPAGFFPTGSQHRGLGAGHTRVFLPVWAQKSFGDWTNYGGAGYWLNHYDPTGDKNYWFYGWLLQRKITDQLTLGGEVFHQTADTIGGPASTGFSFGGSYDFD
jgi:Putative MetA-pathway of phenol degradation